VEQDKGRKMKARDLKAELQEIQLDNEAADREPIVAYYGYKPSDKPNKRLITRGTVLTGIYVKKIIGKRYGDFTYLIKTSDGLFGLNDCSALRSLMKDGNEGKSVKITYNGKGLREGATFESHSFFVTFE
jgi:hypothetical protein